MPRVLFKHIVSFSSELPEHPAKNLLNKDISKQKWLCGPGSTSASIVLQLQESTAISYINIGAVHCAFVEVQVGRSENSSKYEVLVPSKEFVNYQDSQKKDGVEKIQTINKDKMCASVREQMWDVIRIVCTQPYNRHSKYGLVFVHVFKDSPNNNQPSKSMVDLDVIIPPRQSVPSGESEKDKEKDVDISKLSTEQQIKRANTLIFQTGSDAGIAMKKFTIPKKKVEEPTKDRKNSRDDRTSHREGRRRYSEERRNYSEHRRSNSEERRNNREDRKSHREDRNYHREERRREDKREDRDKHDDRRRNEESSDRKRKRYDDDNDHSRSKSTLLSDVVFVLSGYKEPERSEIRESALRMGAQYKKEWTSDCTHLICAFQQTPKLKQIRSGAQRKTAIAVKAEWITRCRREGKRLPWQWFATEPDKRLPRDQWPQEEPSDDDEDMAATSRNSPQPGPSHRPSPSHTPPPRETEYDYDTDERAREHRTFRKESKLKTFFKDYKFLLDPDVDTFGVQRIIVGYGGTILRASNIHNGRKVDFIVCRRRDTDHHSKLSGIFVKPKWLWKCHKKQAMVDHTSYIVT